MTYKVLAIFQLVILVFYLLRPVLPYIEYAVNKDFIAKNLCVNRDKPKSCCQGKCYLQKQVKNSSETNDDKEKNSSKKIQNEDVKEFLSSHFAIPAIFVQDLIAPINLETTLSSMFVSSIFIPPQHRFII